MHVNSIDHVFLLFLSLAMSLTVRGAEPLSLTTETSQMLGRHFTYFQEDTNPFTIEQAVERFAQGSKNVSKGDALYQAKTEGRIRVFASHLVPQV